MHQGIPTPYKGSWELIDGAERHIPWKLGQANIV
ncbi:Hypothetical protein Minf_2070 [Methylacidiphilum infernorum V4]|uniref:Uncharacterized protein n=2 Tax=Candidatus Methylacidiphilum infernorum TaxID=511746 RepID=B3DZ32_METI4|nr:Hypothetical protein Minf_2070 [Methylacidiphilum infernorum V4]